MGVVKKLNSTKSTNILSLYLSIWKVQSPGHLKRTFQLQVRGTWAGDSLVSHVVPETAIPPPPLEPSHGFFTRRLLVSSSTVGV